ncbi:ECF-type sigma factor [Acidicapsa dinghuensis]|uniref:ECF-type sigma factor n=1 Tax=Acidicapsa dinghuensis TaxID=2218256 RepID=A0ABW1EM65_9BACT|nr:ECF-type sigma factor [Acidicapsa dinghuensis]
MQTAYSLTRQLRLFSNGHRDVGDSMLREMFPRLRQIAARRLAKEQYPSFTPTELIGETWLTRLHRGGWKVENREHFFGIANRAMRNVLTDAARKRLSGIRGKGAEHICVEEAATELRSSAPDAEQVLAIGMLMEKLKEVDPGVALVVHLHYIAGFDLQEIAAETGLSLRQVRHRWHKGKTWLATRLLSKRRQVRVAVPYLG